MGNPLGNFARWHVIKWRKGGNMSIWNVETGLLVRTLSGHTKTIWSLKVLKNGTLASGSDDNTIKIWNTQSGHLLRTLSAHSSRVTSLEELWSGDDCLLFSGSRDKTVRVWSLNNDE